MPMDINKYKKKLDYEIESLLDKLKNFGTDINLENQKEDNLLTSIKSIEEMIQGKITTLGSILEFYKRNVEWESFNIAFFGETNAGKSTLIEALIKGDGGSIGEGYKDYTKCITKYKKGNIILLDLPGIEGNEKEYQQEIQKAVEKAHLIFYVLEPKEPEFNTLQKIKNYLKDKTKVISVINVRAKPGTYEYKEKNLIDNNIRKVAENTAKKFFRVIGKNYYGNIVVNAYIGFLSLGNPNKEVFLKDKQKCNKIFGSLNNAYHFSNIKEIEEKIEEVAKYSVYEILITNTKKVLRNLEELISGILKEKKNYDLALNSFTNETNKTFLKIEEVFQEYTTKINYDVESNLYALKNRLIEICYNGIDEGINESELNKKMEKEINDFAKEFQQILNKRLTEIQSEIKELQIELMNRIDIYSSILTIKNGIDVESIFKKLEFGIKDFFKEVIDVVLFIVKRITRFINPLVEILINFFMFLKKIWDLFFGNTEKKKREAKQKAWENINNEIEKQKKEIQKKLGEQLDNMKKEIDKTKVEAINFQKKLKSFSYRLDNLIKQIIYIKGSISTKLVKLVSKNYIQYAYIELGFDKMFVLGNQIDDNFELLGIKEVIKYKSMHEVLSKIEHTIINNMLIIKTNDEFIYRALNSNPKIFGVKKVRRQKNDSIIL